MKKIVFFRCIKYVVIAAALNAQFSTIAYGVNDDLFTDGSSSSCTAIRPKERDSCFIERLSKYISIPIVGEWLSAEDVCKLTVASTNKDLWNETYIIHPDHPHSKYLWRKIAKSYAKYMPDDHQKNLLEESSTANIREYLKKHHLKISVNACNDLYKVKRLIMSYELGPSLFPVMRNFIGMHVAEFYKEDDVRMFWEEGVLQGNAQAIDAKIRGHVFGWYGYEKNPEAAKNSYEEIREINEFYTHRGDRRAIERKIEGLAWGEYGYKKNLEEAKEMNDGLVEKGDQAAIRKKVCGLVWESYGYKKNLEEAKKLNESLVNQGNQEAIERKRHGSSRREYGYEENKEEAKKLNEALIDQGNQEAIARRIDGLYEGKYGYEENSEEAKKLNEALIDQGDTKAIERKIEGLSWGQYGYEENPEEAKKLNEALIDQEDYKALKRKIEGLSKGTYGYEAQLTPHEVEELKNSFFVHLLGTKDNPRLQQKTLWLLPEILTSSTIYNLVGPQKNFIEVLLAHKNPSLQIGALSLSALGEALKALALKYGFTSLVNIEDGEISQIESNILMKNSYIPY